ncbi:hypothetical protein C0993_010545, partial [Termitomyces sp. T159_Od127]
MASLCGLWPPPMGSALSVVMPAWPMATSTGQATLLPMLVQPIAASTGQLTGSTLASMALTASKVPKVQKAMVVIDEEALQNSLGAKAAPHCVTTGFGDFPANIPEQEKAAQMLVMKAVVFLAPSKQVVVVALNTDSCTPMQYDRIVAITAAKKSKNCEVLSINDNSNYGESQSKEEEEEEEESEMLVQCFQLVQQDKMIAKRK